MKEQTRIAFGLVLMTILTIAILILITQVIPPVRSLPEDEETPKVSSELLGPSYTYNYIDRKPDPYSYEQRILSKKASYDASGNRVFWPFG